MPEFTEQRWTRYGNDRVYVQTPSGADIGIVDLRSGTFAVAAPGYESLLADCLRRWSASIASASAVLADPRAETRVARAAPAAVPEPLDWSRDFALNSAEAASTRSVRSDERSRRVGAKAEAKVRRELSWLDEEWHELPSAEIDDRGTALFHLLIGPPGAILLSVKCHPKANVVVDQSRLVVNGQPRNYVRNSSHNVRKVERLLSAACGQSTAVRAAIVFVDVDDLTVKRMPNDVHVTTSRRLLPWLKSLPDTTGSETVESIYRFANSKRAYKGVPFPVSPGQRKSVVSAPITGS